MTAEKQQKSAATISRKRYARVGDAVSGGGDGWAIADKETDVSGRGGAIEIEESGVSLGDGIPGRRRGIGRVPRARWTGP